MTVASSDVASSNGIVIGSRRSELAQAQTRWVIERLQAYTDQTLRIKNMVTKGDKILDVALSKVGGKGLFVKEIEEALLKGEVDFAVHSMKDMPAELAEGLTIGAITLREDPRDCLISRVGKGLLDLPAGAKVGTSSLRRQAQIATLRPDLKVVSLRGNINTRLRKLAEGELTAVVLAAAGLHRMGWTEKVTEYLPTEVFVPAVGQGALGIECRSEDRVIRSLLKKIVDRETSLCVRAERAFLQKMEGSCQVPIGAYASLEEDQLKLTGFVAHPHGGQLFKETLMGTADEPVGLGEALADKLIGQGAEDILAAVREEMSR